MRWIGSLAVAVLGVAALGLCAWEGTIVQSSSTAHWSVLAVIAVALLATALAGRSRQRETSAEWLRHGATTLRGDVTGAGRRSPAMVAGTAVWVVLVAAAIGWDLNSFVHQAHDLPTMSRLVGDVTRHEWGRAIMFAAWLALGAYLVAGGRRPVAAPGAETAP